MRPPILMAIPPVKRPQPFVARDGNLYRVFVFLKSHERISMRIRAPSHETARFRAEWLYRGTGVYFAFTESVQLDPPAPPPTVEWHWPTGREKRRPYIQLMGRAFRRLFKRDETDDR